MIEGSIYEVQWKEMCVGGSEKNSSAVEAQHRGDKSKREVCAWMDYGYGVCMCVCECVCKL